MIRTRVSLALATLLLAACAGIPTGPLGDAAPRMELKVASGSPESDLASRAIKRWGDLVTERTNGRLTMKYFWAGSLVQTAEMFNGVRDGVADVGQVNAANMSGTFVDVAILELPFAQPLAPEVQLEVQDKVTPLLERELFERNNLRSLFTTTTSLGTPVICKDKFLDSPEAWRGALVRTAGRWQAATLQHWGASPVVIPINELYTALQRGTVDCTLLSYTLVESFRIYEVGRYITRIDHSTNYSVNVLNREVWNKLPAGDQKTMLDAGLEARQHSVELARDAVVKALDQFTANGVKLCTPSQQELRRLRDEADKVWGDIAKESGTLGRDLMAVLQGYRDRVAVGPTVGDTTPCGATR